MFHPLFRTALVDIFPIRQILALSHLPPFPFGKEPGNESSLEEPMSMLIFLIARKALCRSILLLKSCY